MTYEVKPQKGGLFTVKDQEGRETKNLTMEGLGPFLTLVERMKKK